MQQTEGLTQRPGVYSFLDTFCILGRRGKQSSESEQMLVIEMSQYLPGPHPSTSAPRLELSSVHNEFTTLAQNEY